MNHIQYEKWLQYVANELDENTCQKYEFHLFSCDQCLQNYLRAVEASEQFLPKISNEHHFIDTIMSRVPEESKKKAYQKRPFYQQAVFHYVIAAVLTFVLMSSGLFSQLTQMASDFEKTPDTEQTHSLTEQVMDKTLSWMQTIESKNKEAK